MKKEVGLGTNQVSLGLRGRGEHSGVGGSQVSLQNGRYLGGEGSLREAACVC